jgi:hypothetical protein
MGQRVAGAAGLRRVVVAREAGAIAVNRYRSNQLGNERTQSRRPSRRASSACRKVRSPRHHAIRARPARTGPEGRDRLHPAQTLAGQTQKSRNLGRRAILLYMASCWRQARFSRASWRSPVQRTGRSRRRWSRRVIIEPRFSPNQGRQINGLTVDGILVKDRLSPGRCEAAYTTEQAHNFREGRDQREAQSSPSGAKIRLPMRYAVRRCGRSTLWERHLCPALRAEQRVNVGAAPVTTPPIGNMRPHPKATVSPSAVRDNPDGLVSELISADVVVEMFFITSNDDQPAEGARRQPHEDPAAK